MTQRSYCRFNMRWIVLCFGLCAFVVVPDLCPAQATKKGTKKAGTIPAEWKEKSQSVDAIVRKYLHDDGPGLALLIVKDGQTGHKQGYGLANLRREIPITPQTNFELASVSKQFTAMAIMILHDRGKLSFDDDIHKFFPNLPGVKQNRPVRVRDVLQHISGLPDYMTFKTIPARDPDFPTNADILREMPRHPMAFPTGTKYEYNNSNYVVLASLVEKLSGKTFGTFMHDEIFRPLGMSTTVVYEQRTVDRGRRAIGYGLVEGMRFSPRDTTPAAISAKTQRKNFRVWEEDTVIVGDGSVWSNLEDMARWDAALRDKKLIKLETYEAAFTNLKLDNGNEPDENYGFGWELYFNRRGHLFCVGHGGSWYGFGTDIQRHLDDNLTIVTLCNIDDFSFAMILREVVELYTGKPDRVN